MKTYTFHTIHTTIAGDLHTPVETYLKVRDLFPQSVLLESSDYHGSEDNRSFICLDPIASVSISHGMATYVLPDGTREEKPLDSQFTAEDALRGFIGRLDVTGDYARYCGLYGYTAYDAVRHFEPVDIPDCREAKNDAPDMLYTLFRYVIVFRDYRSEMTLVGLEGEDGSARLSDVERAVNNRDFALYPFRTEGGTTSTSTDDEHRARISRAVGHCLRGDVFQVVLSRRFVQHYRGDDFMLYRALRHINPSPYLFYLDFGGFRLIGSSPETHCKVEGKRASIDPIAGTTRRRGNPTDDQAAIEALLTDPKENAEHTMLVDLARNDLSRTCDGVHLDFYKEPQLYSHVIHLVSRVSGTLSEGCDAVKAFVSSFPAGTLSGAPKVRAMQIINELEPHTRGAYGGCVGFIGLDGMLNQAITIRTFVSRNHELWFQAGGGIVAASQEENELQEINNKLGALRNAILMAEQMSSGEKTL